MKALIMAAGYGTRLEPLTKGVPKPMVLVVNKPILEYNIELLQKFGIKEICMNIHYHPEQIENYFQDGSRFGVSLTYSYEEKLLGTAGGVKKMAELMGIDETFIVISSDNLTDINIGKMVAYHKSKKALVTIALTEVEDVANYGVAVMNTDGRITGFQEKPAKEEAQSKWANAGIYIFEPEVLDLIPDGNFYDFGKELFPKLVEAQGSIFGYQMVEYWGDVGNIEAYLKTNADALQGLVCVKISGRKTAPDLYLGKGTKVHKSAIFEGVTFIGDRTDIGKNTKIIGTSVIGDMCIIGNDVVIKNSIIWPDTYIGPGSFIEESIVGSWCHLKEHTHLGKLTVLENRSNL
ncbi:MAG: NDP-sugar synthase [Candidatus Saganbacteria bacterium]|nr:NDP-sugar synthase [Candidatus Saganbacteria bacterium]